MAPPHLEGLLEKLHKGTDFLYGVIVAVSIEKAIEGIMHVSFHEWFMDPTHPHELTFAEPAPIPLMVWRLLIFLMMVARFYFGSIRYFHDTYANPDVVNSEAYKIRFAMDFFVGLLHFILFFVLSLSVTTVPGNIVFYPCYVMSSFAMVLLIILLYDTVWLYFRTALTQNRAEEWREADQQAHNMIKHWSHRNLVVSFLIIACLIFGGLLFPQYLAWVEATALIFLFKDSFKDFRELTGI